MHKRLTILGSGPAGLTAAIYAARAGLAPLVLHGSQAGGQLMTTTVVENFPGFKDGIMGPALMDDMQAQALRFGAEFLSADAESCDLSRRPFVIKAGGQTIETDALIIACGASPKLLGLPAESKLMGRGVSVCATCDGAFFKGRKVFVVGGGDSALEEAITLTRFASSVTVIHRRDQFRASKIMVDRARSTAGLDFLFDSVVDDLTGTEALGLSAITVRNLKTGEVRTMPADGLFVAIGHTPNTALFQGQLEMNERGYLKSSGTRTSIEGIFVAGEVHDERYRQAIVAAGEGCAAALEAQWFLQATASDAGGKSAQAPGSVAATDAATATMMTEAEAIAIMERFHKHLNLQQWHLIHVVPHGNGWMLIVAVGDEETLKLIPDSFEGLPVSKSVEPDDGTREQARVDYERQQSEASTHATVVVDESNFETRVLQSDVPVVLDFWAEWCSPCRAIAPKIEELAREYQGRLVIGKWECDKDSNVWERFNVRGIPTLILYKDGQEVKRLSGHEPRELLRHEFDALLAEPPADSQIERDLRAQLDATMAAAMEKLERAQRQCWEDLQAKIPADITRRCQETEASFEAEVDKRTAELKARFDKGEVSEEEYLDARYACLDQLEADPAFAEALKAREEAQQAYRDALQPLVPGYQEALARCEDAYNAEVSAARTHYRQTLASLTETTAAVDDRTGQEEAASVPPQTPAPSPAGWLAALASWLKSLRIRIFGN